MAGSWGTKEKGCRVGLFWDDVELSSDGSKARIIGGKIKLDVDQRVTDQTNKLTWTGGAVANGTKSNLNIDQTTGSKTLVNVTGEWNSLSSTREVTATGSVTLSGLSWVGSDIKVTVTATYPKRKGSGTPLPPEVVDPAAPTVVNPWEDEDMPDVYSDQLIQYTYLVEFSGLADVTKRNVPAWDVTVTLDGGRAPYGTAEFNAPLEYLTGAGMNAATSPFNKVAVKVWAGWKYGTTVNQHPIFCGLLSERRMVIEEEDAYVVFTAETYEMIYEYPSHKSLAVNNTHTRISQFFTITGTDLYRSVPFVDSQAGTPSSAELAEFRAMVLEANDSVGDFMRALGAALNQWTRGVMNTGYPGIEVIRDPFPYVRLWELPVNMFSRLERSSALADWANIVRLTTEWTDPTTGDTKSKVRAYPSVEAVSGTEIVRSTDVTIHVKPPGGTTPSTSWPTGLRWLRRTDVMNRANYSADCRAIWWLQPRIDGIKLLDNPLSEGPGHINTITFLVDQGMMSMTWAAVQP